MTVTRQVQTQIRQLDAAGVPGREIARRLAVSRDSVAKYANLEDCSPQPPRPIRHPRASVIAPFTDMIDGWLTADRGHPRKQRHTAKRVFDRLVAEHGYTGSYSPVQRWVKAWKADHREEGQGYAELTWAPGIAQVDFGQADAIIAGRQQTLQGLVVTFPHSNMRFVQMFGGHTSECVCEGLSRVFTRIGGAAPVLVFDNATEAGRRRGTEITESVLFSHFKEHYRLQSRYCNPYSGHEKGSVENAVGFLRRNLMVPIPHAASLTALNADLMDRCAQLGATDHYRAQVPIADLFADDRAALLGLPGIAFDPVTYQRRRADKDGRVQIHDTYYLAGPAWGSRDLTVGLRADTITFLDDENQTIRVLPRHYGHTAETVFDPASLIAHVIGKPASFGQSLLRTRMPQAVADWLDAADATGRRAFLRAIDQPIRDIGFDPVLDAAASILAQGRDPEAASISMLAHHLAEPGPGPARHIDLSVYDQLAPATTREAS